VWRSPARWLGGVARGPRSCSLQSHCSTLYLQGRWNRRPTERLTVRLRIEAVPVKTSILEYWSQMHVGLRRGQGDESPSVWRARDRHRDVRRPQRPSRGSARHAPPRMEAPRGVTSLALACRATRKRAREESRARRVGGVSGPCLRRVEEGHADKAVWVTCSSARWDGDVVHELDRDNVSGTE